MGGERKMFKFLLGIIVGILLFFLFLFFGGGSAVKKVGEGLTDTGKKMEVMEEMVKKEKDEINKGIEKKIFKEEKDPRKKTQ
jgi:hypothetical protein